MARRYLIVSDLHLADVEAHDDGWKDYKHPRHVFDGAFARALEDFAAAAASGERCTLVLNGDIFDFDIVAAVPDDPPWPVSRVERRRGLEATEAKSAWKMERILRDHTRFVRALARFLAAGHEVVYIAGNHDPELHFPGVREVFRRAIAGEAKHEGLDHTAGRLRFEPWFYYVPGEIYVEHGQQYDYYASFRHVLDPIVRSHEPPTVALPMGNLANRYLMTRMGFFNPFASDYILNVFRYATHWLRHYAFSRRGLFFVWLFGSIAVLFRLLRTKKEVSRNPPDARALLERQARRANIPLDVVEALDGLKRTPITHRVYRMVREFWIDRLFIALGMTGGTIALALSGAPTWAKLLLPLAVFPLVYLIYEAFAHGETIFTAEGEMYLYAARIAALLPVKVVAFGHTHKPHLRPIRPGVFYANTGTWAPVTQGRESRRLVPGLRDLLAVTVHRDHAEVRLDTALDEEPPPPRRR